MRHGLLGFALGVALLPLAAWAQERAPSAAQRQALGIELGKAEAARDLPVDGLPAIVQAPLDDSAVVTAPYAGVVLQVLVREGDAVRRGQPLARVQSREAMTLGADLVAARGESRLADAQAARDRQLLAEGIIPAARAQAAEARRDAAAARLRELQAAAAVAPPAQGGAPGVYELRTPRDGRVIERALRPGEPVALLAKAFVVARRDRVLLELHVPARHAAALRTGLGVRLRDGVEGRVVEVGGAVDAASQTVPVRAEVADGRLLAGQQLSATLLLPAPPGAVRLPSRALAEHAGGDAVFVAGPRGFSAVPVELLAQTADGYSVVRGALKPGAEIVVAGAGALGALPAAGH